MSAFDRSRKEVHDPLAFIHESDGVAFGELLRRAREERQLTLREIADETKIPTRHLEALERGNLRVIPGGVYRRSETRAYAKAVGLDVQVALAELDRALQLSAARQAAAHAEAPRGLRGPSRNQMLIVVGVLAGALVVLGLAVSRQQPPNPGRLDERPVAGAVRPPVVETASGATTRALEDPMRAVQVLQGPPVGAATPAQPSPDAEPSPPPPRALVPANRPSPDAELPPPPPRALVPADRPSPDAERPPPPPGALVPANQPSPDAELEPPPPGALVPANQPSPDAELPPPPGALVPAEGEIAIFTTPEGARVTIDGIGWGTTPVTIRHLPLGDRRVRVTMNGYASEERIVRLVAGSSSATVNIPLNGAP